MSRWEEVIRFIEFDRGTGVRIDPENRHAAVKERLFDALHTYKPGVIVKAGLGNGALALEMAAETNSYIAVVEPSGRLIGDFLERNGGNPLLERIRLINGDFQNFPVDYYAADLLVCVDYLDFFDTGKCIDEFRRALQFEGIFFFAGVALSPDDLEGIYDDFMRILFPLHNDYYLPDDFRTMMELKGFTSVKGALLKFAKSLPAEMEYFRGLYKDVSRKEAQEFLDSRRDGFRSLYGMDDLNAIEEPYVVGVFMRNQPEKPQATL